MPENLLEKVLKAFAEFLGILKSERLLKYTCDSFVCKQRKKKKNKEGWGEREALAAVTLY